MVHYKYRYKNPRSCHQRVVDFLNTFDRIASKRCPFVHSILFPRAKSAGRAHALGRTILNLVVGLLFGYSLHYLFIGRLEGNHGYHRNRRVRLSIVWTIALAYVRSVNVRAIVCLILTKADGLKIMLLLFMFAKILDLTFTPLALNFRRIFSSLFCFFAFRITERYHRFDMSYIEPLKTIANKIFFSNEGPQELADAFRAQSDMIKLNLSSTMNDVLQMHQDLSWPDGVITLFQHTCSSALLDQFPGFFVFLKPAFKGREWFCNLLIELVLRPFLVTAKPKDMFKENMTSLDSMLDSMMVDGSEQMKMIKQTQKNIINNQNVVVVASQFNDLNTFMTNQMIVGQEPRVEETLGFMYYLTQWILFGVLVTSVLKASSYHQNYLTSLEFDNNYINRYFHHVDERRKNAGKSIRILPLNGLDLDHMTEMYSVQLSNYEQTHKSISRKTILILCLLCFIPVYINLFVAQYLQILNHKLNEVYKQTIVHRFNPQMQASDLMAPAKLLVDWMQFNLSRNFEFNLANCVQPVEEMQREHWIDLAVYFGMIVLLTFLSSYMVRLCPLICDYFYPRQGKRRILALYNEKLQKRKDYISR